MPNRRAGGAQCLSAAERRARDALPGRAGASPRRDFNVPTFRPTTPIQPPAWRSEPAPDRHPHRPVHELGAEPTPLADDFAGPVVQDPPRVVIAVRDVLRVLAQLYNGTRGTVRHVAKDEVVLATDSRPPCSRASATSRPAPRKGSKWLRGTLTESAKAIVRTKGTYLVRPLPPDQEPPRTRQRTIATAHKIITAACHVLDRGVPYNELGEEFFYRRDTEHTERYRRLGHKVTLEPLEEAA